jgi:hypothetical protein
MRRVVVAVLVAVCASACAPRRPAVAAPDLLPPFVPDVSDDEWNAAIPAQGSRIVPPHLLAGPLRIDRRELRGIRRPALTTVAHVLRADGTIGLYRITRSTNAELTAKVIVMMRAQVYERPLLNGTPVAVRGEISFRLPRTP